MNKNNKVFIQNFWYANNYGAVLTAFALYKLIEVLGYDVSLIDISNKRDKQKDIFHNFITKYCNITKHIEIKNILDLESINIKNATYVLGSDQVLRPFYLGSTLEYFLFNYVNRNSKKIAFSASFGVDKNKFIAETSKQNLELIKQALSSFDFISTREESGVKICKEVFDTDANWTIDPVFILNSSIYDE